MRLCQVRTLWQSQEFMPQIIRDFVYFVFMFIKLIFYRNIYIKSFIIADSEGE